MDLRHHDGNGARHLKDAITEVYSDAYADRLHIPFYTVSRFLERLDMYVSRSGYELVTAHSEDGIVGLIYGFPRPPGTAWWKGLTPPLPNEVAEKAVQGGVFALADMMVRVGWRRQGVARALHDDLLAGREEELATLLVRPDNEPAQAAYRKWGWQKIGELQPFPDSPSTTRSFFLSAPAPVSQVSGSRRARLLPLAPGARSSQ